MILRRHHPLLVVLAAALEVRKGMQMTRETLNGMDVPALEAPPKLRALAAESAYLREAQDQYSAAAMRLEQPGT